MALHVPDEDLRQYLELGWDDPPFTAEQGGYTPHFTPRAAYAAMISHLDRHVGDVVAKLNELGLREKTLIVFSADNGTTHLREEVDYDFFNSVGELKGLKGSLYEGGVRVPTIVSWPGRIAPGTESDRISGFEDWLPTLAEIAGAQDLVPSEINGISLLPTLFGEIQPERPYLYREFPAYGGQQSVRAGEWKAVRQNMTKGNLEVELYNLRSDPGEQSNVAKEHPEIAERMTRLMETSRVPSRLYPLKPLDAGR